MTNMRPSHKKLYPKSMKKEIINHVFNNFDLMGRTISTCEKWKRVPVEHCQPTPIFTHRTEKYIQTVTDQIVERKKEEDGEEASGSSMSALGISASPGKSPSQMMRRTFSEFSKFRVGQGSKTKLSFKDFKQLQSTKELLDPNFVQNRVEAYAGNVKVKGEEIEKCVNIYFKDNSRKELNQK